MGKEGFQSPLTELCHITSVMRRDELLRKLQGLSRDELGDVIDRYRERVTRSGPIRAGLLPQGEIRPYIPTDTDERAFLHGGIDGGPKIFCANDATWKYIDQIKNRLIYCHHVAIDDPVRMVFALAASHITSGERAITDEMLAHCVDFLLAIDEWVQSGTISFVDFGLESQVSWGIHRHVADALEKAIPDNSSSAADLGEIVAFADVQAKKGAADDLTRADARLLPGLLRDLSLKRMGRALTSSLYGDGRITPYLPFRQDIDHLHGLSERDWGPAFAGLKELPFHENRLMNRLFEISLPGLKHLSVADIASLRDEDSFVEGRQVLKEAMAYGITHELTKEQLTAELKERVKAAVARIEAATEKSSALSAGRTGAVSFAGGTVSVLLTIALTATFVPLALSAAPMALLLIGIAGAAGASATDMIAELLKSSDKKDALLRSYVSILG